MVDHLIDAVAVEYRGGYTLRVTFEDGAVRDVDLSGQLQGPVFEPLKDTELFRKAYVDPETMTVTWPGGADAASDALYEMGVAVEGKAA
jgi:hypothetical protein